MGTEQVPVFSAATREVCFCSEHHRVLHSVLQSDRHKQTDRAAGGFSRGARIAFAVRHNWINRAVKKVAKNIIFFFFIIQGPKSDCVNVIKEPNKRGCS